MPLPRKPEVGPGLAARYARAVGRSQSSQLGSMMNWEVSEKTLMACVLKDAVPVLDSGEIEGSPALRVSPQVGV